MRAWVVVLLVASTTPWCPGLVPAAGAQEPCVSERALVAPERYSGLAIRSLAVESDPPGGRVAGIALLRHLHRATRVARIRQELLFAPGDTVDTLRIGESMRRLRSLGFLESVELDARSCPGVAGVDLRLRTTDRWSFTPALKLRPASTTVGFDERNAFGVGMGLRLGVRSDAVGTGLTAAARVPGLPGPALATEVGMVSLANGGTQYVVVGPRRHSAADRWTLDARASMSNLEPRTRPASTFERSAVSLLVGRRVGRVGESATYLLAGGEALKADLAALPSDAVLDVRSLRRSYAGANLGVARIAARYDTLTWLLPRGGVVDVPRGVEGELLAGAGRDQVTGASALHLDGWVGRAVSLPRSGTLLLGDAWASGFLGDRSLSASTIRGSFLLRQRTAGGSWSARLAGERLIHPDPDVRALATLDPIAPAFPRTARLAEAALAASVEREVRLHSLTRSADLAGAVFAAGSYHWDVVETPGPRTPAQRDELGLAALGVGLRIAPARSARASVRLDVGFPVARTAGTRGRPFVALSVSPWPLSDRERDGRKLP